jgi:hypothetical protein
MKVKIHVNDDHFGPVNGTFARMFWAFGFIPKGTLVSVDGDDSRMAIEDCPSMNAFSKSMLANRDYVNGMTLLSQKVQCSQAQLEYMQDLGWPFSIETLNYYQADFLRKEIEKAFPERLRPLIDPDNPWSPGSLKPMNITHDVIKEDWKNLPPSNRQLKVIRFFGFQIPPKITRGLANTAITRLFEDADKRKQWEQYKTLTGDFYDDSAELKPFDPEELHKVRIDPEYCAVRTRMHVFLNSQNEYAIPWLKMADMEKIVDRESIQPFFDSGDLDTFKTLFLQALQSYSPEIADRERRHRINDVR